MSVTARRLPELRYLISSKGYSHERFSLVRIEKLCAVTAMTTLIVLNGLKEHFKAALHDMLHDNVWLNI